MLHRHCEVIKFKFLICNLNDVLLQNLSVAREYENLKEINVRYNNFYFYDNYKLKNMVVKA